MEKFIAYEKLSKKEQKKLNSAKRGSWGLVKPITKVKESAKVYNRKKKQDFRSFVGFQNPAFEGSGRKNEAGLLYRGGCY